MDIGTDRTNPSPGQLFVQHFLMRWLVDENERLEAENPRRKTETPTASHGAVVF